MATEFDYLQSKRGLSVGSLLIGVLIGAVAGGVAAMLLTPKSGKETRAMLRGKAVQTQQMMQERFANVKERIGKVRENMRARAQEEMHQVEQAGRG